VNSYPPEELARSRISELRSEARREIQARLARCPRSLSEALCRLRTRIGAAVIAVGRWIVPAEVRAGLIGPARELDHC